MKWRKILFILTTLVSTVLVAQNETIDSLWKTYGKTKNDQDRIQLLHEISDAFKDIDINEGILVAYQALNLSRQINYLPGVFDACNNLGIYYDLSGQLDSSFLYYDKALITGIQLDDPYLIAIANNNLGTYYVFQGNYALALQYFQEALSENIYPGDNMDPVFTYANIGLIYEDFGNIDKAIEYYQKSIASALEDDEEYYSAFIKLSLGYIAFLRGNYDEAIREYTLALAIYQKHGTKIKVAETLYYLGTVYLEQNKFEIALKTQKEALALYEEQNSILDIPSMYATIAKVYERAGDRNNAQRFYNKAIKLAKDLDSPTDLVNIYEELAQNFANSYDYKEAYKYQQLFLELSDTLYNRETRGRIDQLEMTYKLKVKAAENDKLIAERAEKEAILKQRTLVALGASLLAILIGLIAYIYYRANRQRKVHNQLLEKEVAARTAELLRANNRLLESNEELERFTYIASHDLKEPLRNITSFVNLIQRKLKDSPDENLQEYMHFVTTNTKQMYELLNDILNFSRITSSEESKYEKVDLNKLLEEVRSSLSTMLKEKKGAIQASKLPVLMGPKAQLFLIFKNLIENGIKYNESDKANINVDSLLLPDGFYQFKIKDNGIGIAKKYHDQIFEMFKRLNNRNNYNGSGIGLATCKKIISKYGGDIWIESQEGAGSSFYFTFPKSVADIQVASKNIKELRNN